MKTDTANNTYDFSIVIVTFNNQSHIQQTLKSLSKSLTDFTSQLIIIDNNSQDSTCNQISNITNVLQFTDVQFIKNSENVGFTRAVNQGLVQSTGRNILILNPDIICQSNTFEILIDYLNKDRDRVITPQLRYENDDIQPSCRRFPKKRDVFFEITGIARIFSSIAGLNSWKMPDFDHNHSKTVEQPQGAFLLIPVEVLKKVGLLDERFPMFFSDVDWCKRVYDQGFSIYFTCKTFVYHLKGASIYPVRDRMIVSSHKSFVEYFKKYDHTLFDRVLTKLIHLLLLVVLLPRLLALYILKVK